MRCLALVLATPALGFVTATTTDPAAEPLRSDEVDDADCLDDCLAEDEYDEPVPRTVAPLLDGPSTARGLDEAGDTNMNVVTYATPVGIRPERRWALSLFKSTVSRASFARRRRGVLQLLRPEHAPLVYALGGTCGGRGRAAACARVCVGSSDWDRRVLPRSRS